MSKCNWVFLKQDLRTLWCQRCGATHAMSIAMPAPMDEHLAILQAAGEAFTEFHSDCVEVENSDV